LEYQIIKGSSWFINEIIKGRGTRKCCLLGRKEEEEEEEEII